MNPSFLLKLFVTAALLGYLVSALALWLCRSTLLGLAACAGRGVSYLPYRSGQ